jgi:DNA-directed RNA polymerase subunit beta'
LSPGRKRQKPNCWSEELQENVIVGHLIPAGTGLREYDDIVVGSLEDYEALMSAKKEDAHVGEE